MPRSDDENPDSKEPAGAKKKRAPAPKPAARARKAGAAAKPPAGPAPRKAGSRAAAGKVKAEKADKAEAAGKTAVKKTAAAPRARKPAPPKAAKAPKAAASAAPAKPKAPARPPAPRRAKAARPSPSAPAVEPAPEPVETAAQAVPEPTVSEEERIGDAKYQPRQRPKRAFEEERFLFPETYGQNRVRLLVKDPEWLFAHWDVAPASFDGLRRELGERTAALSRLTLRIRDPHQGGLSVILLPEGVRSWYVKADHAPRAYRAELGFTLPSGEFRGLAESNTVRTPWVGASGDRARRRSRFDGVPSRETAWEPATAADPRQAAPGPWTPDPAVQIGGEAPAPAEPTAAPTAPGARPQAAPGGASDIYRR